MEGKVREILDEYGLEIRISLYHDQICLGLYENDGVCRVENLFPTLEDAVDWTLGFVRRGR